MKTTQRSAQFWPVILGAVLALGGVAGGYLAPVGEYCAATFLPQTAAAQQDRALASGSTQTTHYADACWAAASQQSALWWGLIILGAVIVAVGLAWHFAPLRPEDRSRLRAPLGTLWGGVGLLFVGLVGGWAIPVGKDCSGAFGDQAPAAIVMAKTGSSAELTACHSAAASDSPTFAGVAILGAAVLAAALILLAVGVVRIFRARSGVAPIRAGGWRDVWRNGPRWPLLLGLGVIAAAALCGFAVPVGPYCSGAFTSQSSSLTEDLHQAFTYNRITDYHAACSAAGAQQAVLWWVLIAVGVALVTLAFILRQRFLQRYAAGGPLAPAPSPPPVLTPSPAVPTAVTQPSAAVRATAPVLPAPSPGVPFSIAGELAKLAELRDRDVLTQDEFEQQKARLLAL